MKAIAGLIIGFWVGVLFFELLENLCKSTYKDGQIDALTGKVHYQLVVKPDSTRVWQYKK
jgi:hypothetical protein